MITKTAGGPFGKGEVVPISGEMLDLARLAIPVIEAGRNVTDFEIIEWAHKLAQDSTGLKIGAGSSN